MAAGVNFAQTRPDSFVMAPVEHVNAEVFESEIRLLPA